MRGELQIICSVVFSLFEFGDFVFVQTLPPPYMFNAYGDELGTIVVREDVGEYYFTTGASQGIEFQKISITARASDEYVIVTVVPTETVDGETKFSIKVRDDEGELTDFSGNCEVTISRLPLV